MGTFRLTPEDPAAEKALFIPLKRVWFEAFLRGVKDTEYRAYGPRWNEATCRVGRKARLSLGYSNLKYLDRTVAAFEKLPRDKAPEAAREIYPKAPFIAAIKLATSDGE